MNLFASKKIYKLVKRLQHSILQNAIYNSCLMSDGKCSHIFICENLETPANKEENRD